MERNHRTSIQGVVTSCNMAKTIVVTVSTERNDPIYGKRVGYSKKYYAHDENGLAKVGDTVTISACRPMSKLKRFRLVSVDKKAEVILDAEAVEANLEEKEGVKEVETSEEAK
ncbi:MAG: 30S ribosomal protein S17 [Bacilli bacterium]|nr:30S ribosomal protein S17 [Bacilli bacterium]